MLLRQALIIFKVPYAQAVFLRRCCVMLWGWRVFTSRQNPTWTDRGTSLVLLVQGYVCLRSWVIIMFLRCLFSIRSSDPPILMSPLPSPRTQFYAASADSGKFI